MKQNTDYTEWELAEREGTEVLRMLRALRTPVADRAIRFVGVLERQVGALRRQQRNPSHECAKAHLADVDVETLEAELSRRGEPGPARAPVIGPTDWSTSELVDELSNRGAHFAPFVPVENLRQEFKAQVSNLVERLETYIRLHANLHRVEGRVPPKTSFRKPGRKNRKAKR